MTDVTFYLPGHPDLSIWDEIDPQTDWSVFKTGRDQWIPYTYVRLRQAGHSVSIASDPPRTGIVVVFAADLRQFLSECRQRKDVILVCAQADRFIPEVFLADLVVQHNQLEADGKRNVFIPNWPQPGLIPRDPSRGTHIVEVSYKGRLINLHEEFLSREWNDFLLNGGMRFRIDTSDEEPVPDLANLAGFEVDTTMRWNDYSSTDVVLAVRPFAPGQHPRKPGLKLINSWLAGVPALLGNEHGYREIRQSHLDFIEVASMEDAVEGIKTLRRNPELYESMVANGRARAQEFTTDVVRRLWEDLLFRRLADWRPSRITQMTRPLFVPGRRLIRRGKRWIRLRHSL